MSAFQNWFSAKSAHERRDFCDSVTLVLGLLAVVVIVCVVGK